MKFYSFSEPQCLSALHPFFLLYSSTLGCVFLPFTTRYAWIAVMQIQYLFVSEPPQNSWQRPNSNSNNNTELRYAWLSTNAHATALLQEHLQFMNQSYAALVALQIMKWVCTDAIYRPYLWDDISPVATVAFGGLSPPKQSSKFPKLKCETQ